MDKGRNSEVPCPNPTSQAGSRMPEAGNCGKSQAGAGNGGGNCSMPLILCFVSHSKPPCGEGKGVSETEIPGIPPLPASSRWDPAGSRLGGDPGIPRVAVPAASQGIQPGFGNSGSTPMSWSRSVRNWNACNWNARNQNIHREFCWVQAECSCIPKFPTLPFPGVIPAPGFPHGNVPCRIRGNDGVQLYPK